MRTMLKITFIFGVLRGTLLFLATATYAPQPAPSHLCEERPGELHVKLSLWSAPALQTA